MKSRVSNILFSVVFVCVLISGCGHRNITDLKNGCKITYSVGNNEMIVKSIPEPINSDGICNLYSVAISDGGKYYFGLTTLADLKVNEIVVWKHIRFNEQKSMWYISQTTSIITRVASAQSEKENSKLSTLAPAN